MQDLLFMLSWQYYVKLLRGAIETSDHWTKRYSSRRLHKLKVFIFVEFQNIYCLLLNKSLLWKFIRNVLICQWTMSWKLTKSYDPQMLPLFKNIHCSRIVVLSVYFFIRLLTIIFAQIFDLVLELNGKAFWNPLS